MGGASVTGRQPVGNRSSSHGTNGSTGLLLCRWIGRWNTQLVLGLGVKGCNAIVPQLPQFRNSGLIPVVLGYGFDGPNSVSSKNKNIPESIADWQFGNLSVFSIPN
jgi:hypothetical protein